MSLVHITEHTSLIAHLNVIIYVNLTYCSPKTLGRFLKCLEVNAHIVIKHTTCTCRSTVTSTAVSFIKITAMRAE